jgi:type II secretory pathway component HofQ
MHRLAAICRFALLALGLIAPIQAGADQHHARSAIAIRRDPFQGAPQNTTAADPQPMNVPPPVPAAKPSPSPSHELAEPSKTRASNGRISLDARDEDIVDVLRSLASESGVSIITDASVKHEKASLQLHDVSFPQALSVLTHAYDLRIQRESNILIVRSGASSSTAIRLKYIRACDAVKYLRGVLPDRAYGSDDRSNTIIVTGNGDAIATTRALISTIDVPTPQVMFEVRVADIIRNNDSSNVGFLFGGLQSSSSVSNGLTNASSVQTPQQFMGFHLS